MELLDRMATEPFDFVRAGAVTKQIKSFIKSNLRSRTNRRHEMLGSTNRSGEHGRMGRMVTTNSSFDWRPVFIEGNSHFKSDLFGHKSSPFAVSAGSLAMGFADGGFGFRVWTVLRVRGNAAIGV